jgi:hypothetical protein
MRFAALLSVLAMACVPNEVTRRAGDRLHAHGKYLHFMDHGRIDGSDVYTFCRNEHRRDVGGLTPRGDSMFDGACVTLVCPIGDDGHQ